MHLSTKLCISDVERLPVVDSDDEEDEELLESSLSESELELSLEELELDVSSIDF